MVHYSSVCYLQIPTILDQQNPLGHFLILRRHLHRVWIVLYGFSPLDAYSINAPLQ